MPSMTSQANSAGLPAAFVGGLAAVTVAVSTAPRLARAAGWSTDAQGLLGLSDLYDGYSDLLVGGRVPYWDSPFYYPPAIGYLAGLFSVLSRDATTYVLLWGAVIAAAAAGVGFLLASTSGPRTAIVFWSLSPQLLLYSGANFDVLPASFVLVAVLLSRRGRSFQAIALLALGALTKVFPAAVAPLELDRLRRSQPSEAASGVILFVAIVGLVALPSLLAPWPSTLTATDYARRTNFDSVWGLLIRLLEGVGVTEAPGLIAVATAAGLLATYAIAVIPWSHRARDPAVGAALAVLAVLFWTRLYSPQYALWILPLLALLKIDIGSFALLALADVIVFVSVSLTLTYWQPADISSLWLLAGVAAAILLRHIALIRLWLRIAGRIRASDARSAA